MKLHVHFASTLEVLHVARCSRVSMANSVIVRIMLCACRFWFAIAWKDRLFDMAIESDKTSEKLDRWHAV
jgi:hypothetical protein